MLIAFEPPPTFVKSFHLAFHQAWPDTPVIDLLAAEPDLPTDAGAYVLGTADQTMLVYPWATSPIYYIGKAENLRERLLTHRKYIQGAIDDYWDRWWWPRYQYGAAFGASCVWFASTDMPAKALEATLVSHFYLRFGSIPVANTHWPKTPDIGSQSDA